MANISMDPRPTNYLRQNIVFSYPEMIRVSFSLFLCLSVFCYFTLLLIFIKIVLLLLLFYLFIFMKMFFFSCSGMFRNVPECSMFRILSTAPLGLSFRMSLQPFISNASSLALDVNLLFIIPRTSRRVDFKRSLISFTFLSSIFRRMNGALMKAVKNRLLQ